MLCVNCFEKVNSVWTNVLMQSRKTGHRQQNTSYKTNQPRIVRTPTFIFYFFKVLHCRCVAILQAYRCVWRDRFQLLKSLIKQEKTHKKKKNRSTAVSQLSETWILCVFSSTLHSLLTQNPLEEEKV